MRYPLLARSFFLATILAIACASAPAEAKGFFLVTYGDDIDFVRDLTSEAKAAIGQDMALGYKYSSFGLFFLDVWTWGGEYVLYSGDRYSPIAEMNLSDEELAAIVGVASVSEIGKPWNYRFPPGLLLVLAAAGVFAAFKIRHARNEARLRGLFGDERYRHALDMMAPSQDGQPGKSFEQAVDYLVDQRIPPDEARKNLADLVRAAAEASESDD